MDFTTIGIYGILLLFLFLFLGLPISITFLVVAFGGTVLMLGWDPAISLLGETLYRAISSPAAVVIPLFALMGGLSMEGGFAQRAYKAVHTMAARLPGSLAVATSIGSAFFGAVSGSTLASTVVFGKLSYPEMMRAGYDRRFSLGTIASAGTFACMIPPSGMFILFAIFTDLSVGKLFMAGIIPGLLTAGVYIFSIILRSKLNPALAPEAPHEINVRLWDRLSAAKKLWEVSIVGLVVIGGIYSGILTPIGAGAFGCLAAFLIGFIRGPLRKFSANRNALWETAQTCAMLFFMIITALFFSRFLAITRIPMDLASFLETWEVHRHIILLSIFVMWFLLGTMMAQAAVFALTLPILFPVVVQLGYDPIWFCVLAMKFNEIAGVSPPVGLNVFALAGAVGDNTRVEDVYRGVWPFVFCDLIVILLLFMFPAIVTWLPGRM